MNEGKYDTDLKGRLAVDIDKEKMRKYWKKCDITKEYEDFKGGNVDRDKLKENNRKEGN